MYTQIAELVSRIKSNRPLVLNITNHVTMDFIANGLLSMGASPIMTLARQEVEDLLKITQAVVINIGTLHDEFIDLCIATGEAANRLNIPVILDPVGAGASHYRTMTCLDLLERVKFSIIRGNASEIMALSGASMLTKGVDSSIESKCAIENASYLAKKYQTTVVISGQEDFIVDSIHVESIQRGSSIMPMLTGSGCLLSAIVGAFCAVHDNPFDAAVAATLFYSVCGELAEAHSTKPGTFKPHFLDALSLLPERLNYV